MVSTLETVLFQNDASSAAFPMMFFVVWCALVIVVVAGMWKTFDKAGEPGWACIVPIYNLVVLMRIAGKPGWWVILCLIPLVNLIVVIIASIEIARNFGKGAGFGLGLAFLGMIFYPILGFGDAEYQPAT